MLNTVWAVVREGRIVTLEDVEVAEGTRVLVTLLPESDAMLWSEADRFLPGSARDKANDDVYGEFDSAYRQMARDEVREAEALEWAEATIGDVSHETR